MANDKWSGSNPWLGLAPYTEGTPLYGRTRESAQLSDIIKDNMASVVFGKSGIGKSSLLSAGISPLLREENYIPVRIRLVHNTDTSYVEQIENTVRETVNCHDRLPSNVDGLGLWDFFHRHTFTTDDGEDCVPVVILDQFEEIYTLTDADHKKDTISFFIELSALLNDIKPDNVIEEERRHNNMQSSPVATPAKRGIIKRTSASSLNYTSATTFRFVVCLREDKLYLLERSSANIPSLKANRYNLQALSPESALEVIMCPRPDLFSNEEATAIIDKLADMGDEGVRTVDPAILSLFLYKYYEKQGQANYDNIFADYYQEATKDINGKSIAFLENHLLTLGGYRNQVPLDDALSSGVTQSEIDSLLDQIILRTEKRKGIDYIEFSHDRLCAEAKKNREERNMREQARKVRRRMLLSIFIFMVSGGILAYVLLLLGQLQSAEEQNEIISNQKREIAVQSDSLRKSLQLQEALNVTISIQKGEIAEQRDELQAKNRTLTAQQQEIERKNAELQKSNNALTSKLAENAEQKRKLEAQLATIEEQKRMIEELRSKASVDKIVVKNNIAGKLAMREELPYNALMNVSSLTISGDLNTTDKYFLKNALQSGNLKHLDLSNANIVEGGTGEVINKKDELGDLMFDGAKSLETVVLPKTITSIGDGAFSGCSGLTSIYIPNSVTAIGDNAFSGCSSLTSIDIPNSVTAIGDNAFSGCDSLASVNIPNSVTTIGGWAFYNCFKLTSINIPNSVTTIGQGAFSRCEELTSIDIPNSVTTIDDYAFDWCSSLTSIDIPNSVTAIGNDAFSNCPNLMSINIPNSVTTIGDYAFRGCSSLTSIDIPNSITEIGNYAFGGCSNFTSIYIPNSITEIGNYAFGGCSSLMSIKVDEKNVVYDSRDNCNAIIHSKTNTLIQGSINSIIPNSVTTIGDNAFDDCSDLTFIDIPNSVTTIGQGAFDNCSGLTSIYIPNSVTTIGNNAFSDCSGLTSITVDKKNVVYDSRDNCNAIIHSITNTLIQGSINSKIPNSVTAIGEMAFCGCSGLTSINIPNSVTTIGDFAFSRCEELTSIDIPNSVTTIGNNAFSGCSKLTSIDIPNSVTAIGVDVFGGCTNLTHIYSRIENISFIKNEYVFLSLPENCTWHVPIGTADAYRALPGWKWNIIEEDYPMKP